MSIVTSCTELRICVPWVSSETQKTESWSLLVVHDRVTVLSPGRRAMAEGVMVTEGAKVGRGRSNG